MTGASDNSTNTNFNPNNNNTNNNPIELTLYSEQDTQRLAEALAQLDLSGGVWLLGDLGAGKTTLTRYWLQALGHKGKVKSPTYTLVEPYRIVGNDMQHSDIKPVYHVDLYRLQDFEELEFIGFDEYQQEEDALLIIEWASRAEEYLDTPILQINMTQADNVNSNKDNNNDNNNNDRNSRHVVITTTSKSEQSITILNHLRQLLV